MFSKDKVRYNNYHKHDHLSNIFTPDTNSKIIDYINRAIELGEPNVWTTNHGSGGDIFEAKTLCDNNGLHCKFGMEGYIVPNPLEKDSRNYHIVLIPRTNIARKKLNLASSRANIEGYYYKPRLFLEDLLAFDKNELYITTACVAGLLKDEDSYNELFMPLYEHFNDNLFVEVQSHNEDIQKSVNERAIWCRDNLGLKLIHANDSHYIYPYQSNERLELLKGKGINYGEEDSFILDYPTFDEIINRYKVQGILDEAQIKEALSTTLLFDDVEDIVLDKTIKMPTIYPNLNEEEKYQVLVDKVFEGFTKIMDEDNVEEDKQDEYIEECKKELQVIYDTKDVCHTTDYFLLNVEVIKKAVNEYDGVLTRTGRGSCGAFLLNKMLGITQIDRLTVNLPMYSDRFMSTARLLENKAMPDIDFNIVAQEPFVKATRDLLGENGCYPMIAYGTMKESEAFRNVCRSHNLEYDLYNEVGKNLDNYRYDEYWEPFIAEANMYVGTIISASVHPCAHVLLNGDIREEIGVFKIGDAICAMITSMEADNWKYLKNDYLIVSVWDIISQTYKSIGQPIKTIKQLISSLDDDVWKLFDMGMTCTLNQIDGDWATKLLKEFRPRTVEEMAMFVGAIRPNFASLRDDFIARRPHTNGSKYLDELFANTYNRILFQENIMRYFEWLGVIPSLSIGLIKKISKKTIKQEDFNKLESGMKEQWKINTGTYDGFDETWSDMQSQISYGFNSPHGLATALDCLYGAELKAHYPLDYYTISLNIYKDDVEKTSRLINEMKYFGIKLAPIKFRYSNDKYNMDRETNTIYKSVSSIKNMGKHSGEELYALRDEKITTPYQLLRLIKERTSINSKQLDILVKLGFFDEFGDPCKLLKIIEYYNKFIDAKVIAKSKLEDWQLDIVAKHARKETDKQYRDIDNNESLVDDLWYNDTIPETTKLQLAAWEIGLLGTTEIIDNDYNVRNDGNTYIIANVNITSWGVPFITLYDLHNGHIETYKCNKDAFNGNPCENGDIVHIILRTKKKRIKVDDEWVESEEFEDYIKDYSILKRI